jgi:hypothetical protein
VPVGGRRAGTSIDDLRAHHAKALSSCTREQPDRAFIPRRIWMRSQVAASARRVGAVGGEIYRGAELDGVRLAWCGNRYSARHHHEQLSKGVRAAGPPHRLDRELAAVVASA